MIYHLGKFLDSQYDIPGMGMLQYISFRSAMAAIFALFIALVIGRRIIAFLRRKQVGETIRDLGLQGQMEKQGTPTMGGLIIIIALLVPVLLFCDLTNIYILLMLLTTVWLGFLGGLDDYIKVFKKHKEGLHGKFKILGQISLGLIVAVTVLCSEDIVVREPVPTGTELRTDTLQENGEILRDVKSTTTTIPFVKNNEFDYQWLVGFMGDHAKSWVWLAVVLVFIFIITAVSNGANLTDGMDGLAAGTSAIICATLVILAYISGNIIYTRYLNFMYIPNCGELVIFMSALVGALIGFLWYNTNPAQIFMGDTGSLTLGGLIAVCAILIRKELLLPVLCGIFLAESASVLIQTSYFKYTKKKYGAGRRVFLMSPLHHHYQKKGFPEPKIVTRFWIVGIILAIITLATLKIR
ncbi:MAG: phospho-N-acetylmuramoyl-pentapeptide-transferase [Bacteroidales bacterium]|nr:phospho-N-acetylmuramoyl-pentapeptide-transferase [Bacteroidales bacterium]MCR5713770.1 phospho-N-acetylmuramoyl-pentapeptide-transferase [Bacteroidales bacterium]